MITFLGHINLLFFGFIVRIVLGVDNYLKLHRVAFRSN